MFRCLYHDEELDISIVNSELMVHVLVDECIDWIPMFSIDSVSLELLVKEDLVVPDVITNDFHSVDIDEFTYLRLVEPV